MSDAGVTPVFEALERRALAWLLTEAMARRLRWAHPAWGPVWVSTLEDLVLAKLEWSEGTSELQLRDCASLLRMNAGRVDEAYLERWARALGLGDRLESVRRAP
jgi:hypothetical protein